MGACVNFTALDTMINDLHTLFLVKMLVSTIVIQPEAENEKESASQVEKKKEIYIQSDHGEMSSFKR